MFTDLAVVDWIALVFAAILLSAAIAAGFLAYVTSAHHRRPSLSMFRSRRATRPKHAAGAPTTDKRESNAPADEAVVDLTENSINGGRPTPTIEIDERLAERAARLRGRPVPEARPSASGAGAPGLEHRALVQRVVANRAPAHAELLTAPSIRSGVSSDSSNFDRVEGFKARNPGFFDDPMGRHELRYWDGHTWTEYVKEHGERFTDPL